MYRIESCSPAHPDAHRLLDDLSETLAAITGSGGRNSFDEADVTVAHSLFVLARTEDGAAAGCGAYRPLAPGIAELKRMYAAPGTHGLGEALLRHLEDAAARDGYREIRLETRLVNTRAVRFYERHGYGRIANFGKYAGRPEAVCFAKPLGGQSAPGDRRNAPK